MYHNSDFDVEYSPGHISCFCSDPSTESIFNPQAHDPANRLSWTSDKNDCNVECDASDGCHSRSESYPESSVKCWRSFVFSDFTSLSSILFAIKIYHQQTESYLRTTSPRNLLVRLALLLLANISSRQRRILTPRRHALKPRATRLPLLRRHKQVHHCYQRRSWLRHYRVGFILCVVHKVSEGEVRALKKPPDQWFPSCSWSLQSIRLPSANGRLSTTSIHGSNSRATRTVYGGQVF